MLSSPLAGLPARRERRLSPDWPKLRCTEDRLATPAPGGDELSPLSTGSVGGIILLARCERCFEYLLLEAANPLGFHQNQYTTPRAAAMAATPPSAPPMLVPKLLPPEEAELSASMHSFLGHCVQLRERSWQIWPLAQAQSGMGSVQLRHPVPVLDMIQRVCSLQVAVERPCCPAAENEWLNCDRCKGACVQA